MTVARTPPLHLWKGCVEERVGRLGDRTEEAVEAVARHVLVHMAPKRRPIEFRCGGG